MSSSLVENFFGAINTISQANVDAAKRDETIDCEIQSVVNIDIGEYKVEYQGNIFSAEAADPTVTYQKGDKVYVLVPGGDYSRKKIILGSSAYKNNTTYGDLSDMTNFYIIKGPNWLESWYKGLQVPMQICAVEDKYKAALTKDAHFQDYGWLRSVPKPREGYPTVDYPTSFMTNEELAEADEQIRRYSQVYDSIMISANFRTEFQNTHSKGEYRLRVQCIQDNPLYIQDPSHPDYKTSKGDKWLEHNTKYQAWLETIDQNLYDQGGAYKEQIDKEDAEWRAELENLAVQKRYTIVTFDLGFKQFSGAPYAFVADTPQKGYYSTKNALRGLYSISLWQDGQMIADIIPTILADGTMSFDTQNSVLDRNNIFCDNIDIRFAQKVNLTDTLFYAWMETPYGDTLYSANEDRPTGRGSVRLIAHLQHGLQDLTQTSPEAIEVHWFRQKADVTSTTPTEQEKDEHGNTWFDYGGPGWYPIEKLIQEGDKNYAINFNELTVLKEAVDFKWIYKAVIVYRDMSTTEQSEINRSEVEQEIIRLDSKYALKVEQFTSKDGRKTYLRVLDENRSVHEIDPSTGTNYREWFGTWYLELQDGSYTRISDPYLHGPLEINDFLLNDIAIFHVAAYDPYEIDPDNTGIAVAQVDEVTVLRYDVISATDGSLLIDWVGRDTFNYDALGVIKDWAAEKDNTLEPEISWAEGTASDYVITIFGPDGVTPLSNREYYDETSTTDSGKTGQFPNSMMTNIWVDFENTIHFQIENQYDKEKAKPENNIFTVRVQTVNGIDYDFKKTIFFIKDGDMGTIGAEWSAQIKPCNWKYGEDQEEGAYIEALDYPAPLIIHPNGKGGYEQDKNFRVFLRPFVKKNGVPLEQMDPFEGYFYKVYWDVRMPASFMSTAAENRVRYAANLRLYHADGTMDVEKPGALYGRDGTFWENGGMDLRTQYAVEPNAANGLMANAYSSKVNDYENTPGGLIGFTVYPSRQYGSEDPRFNNENYGAIEVRFFDNANEGTGASMEDMLYRFIVKAQVDIMKGQYDQKTKMIQVEGNVERINSIVSYFPVDVLVNEDNIDFSSSDNNFEFFDPVKKIALNWPQYVTYNATGYDPSVFPDAMYFKYGGKGAKEEINYETYNLTPLTQTIETLLNAKTQLYEQFYRAKQHLNMAEGFWGVLRNKPGSSPFGNGYYLRNQVMYLNAYGNVDINGWDGQGIDMNEERGTIFAITVGAGYKRPSTNAFTGVLMGADASLKREDITGDSFAHDEEANKHMPYLTGLFGYQDGVQSFALLENGTAFFGRADRGGRIVIDGTNATIYGGGNGMFESPTIGDPMWNSMRLTLSDLTHAVSPETGHVTGYWKYDDAYSEQGQGTDSPDDDGNGEQRPSFVGLPNGYDENGNPKYFEQGFNGAYFLWNDQINTVDHNKLPFWYKELWSNAYIKPDGALPYWLGTGTHQAKNYADLDRYDGDWEALNTSAEKECKKIDYFWGIGTDPNTGEPYDTKDALIFQRVTPIADISPDDPDYEEKMDEFQKQLKESEKENWDQSNKNNGKQLSGFAPSRASTTPAIEIGQHQKGLMPGLISWCSYDQVFSTLNIPGDRNFMVTYDGTLWAMNGIFMGVLIGSNIVGGRIQGAEIGIGHRPPHADESYVMMHDEARQECEFKALLAPFDALRPIDENGTPGECKKGKGLGFYVDPNGNVIANSIKIYGGSIDIGRFHIMGGRGVDDPDYGHLIQIAESDFIGPVHFYGNVGIGPARNFDDISFPSAWKGMKENQGNLFQTFGFVGLGIPLENMEDFTMHENAVGRDNFMKGPINNYGSTARGGGRDTGIGEGHTLEQNALFGIDAFTSYLPVDGQADGKGANRPKLQGHFWPMHFHYGQTNDTVPGQDGTTVNGYMTVMNIFESGSYSFATGGTNGDLQGTNYFRVGPWGTEGMVHFLRREFQDQNESECPANGTVDGYGQKNWGNYIGFMGLQNRAGRGIGATEAPAIGITSWYSSPIIMVSDGESAWTTRGHFHFFVRGIGGDNVTTTGQTWIHEGNNNGLDYGIVFDMGSNMGGNPQSDPGGNKVILRTASGPIGIGVEKNTDHIEGTWTVPSPHDQAMNAFLYFDPTATGKMAHEGGVFLGTRVGNVHIYRLGESGVCTGPHVPELYLEEKKAMLSAPEEVDIGANWTNGHTPLNYIKMTTTEISFEGSYADEENQKNIYARFA